MGEDAIKSHTYKAAGVNIEAGAELVEAIKPLARSTRRAGVMGGLGGFAGLFDPAAAGFRDPVLVAATDGVGTKLKLAAAVGRHDTVGIDLVAMCVNDLLVQGAEPLFFLDYFATGRLEPDTAEQVITGIAAGCLEAGCALLGGETAEMPGMYEDGTYDLAGFAVGAAERDRLITGEDVTAGDVVLGLASSGLHSNGFSLVRRVVADSGLALSAPAPFTSEGTLAETLLTPTRIYVDGALEAVRGGRIRALAHITGGGLLDNIPRVLPAGLGVALNAESWPLPQVFRWVMHEGSVPADEMARTFNCGIGMAAIAAPDDADEVTRQLTDGGETVYRIGRVVETPPDAPRVSLSGLELAWRG